MRRDREVSGRPRRRGSHQHDRRREGCRIREPRHGGAVSLVRVQPGDVRRPARRDYGGRPVSAAVKKLEDARQAAETAAEELSEAEMNLRRVQLKVQNLDPAVGPQDLEQASSRVQYARLVAEGTKRAAEKAATAQIEDEAREASTALFRD